MYLIVTPFLKTELAMWSYQVQYSVLFQLLVKYYRNCPFLWVNLGIYMNLIRKLCINSLLLDTKWVLSINTAYLSILWMLLFKIFYRKSLKILHKLVLKPVDSWKTTNTEKRFNSMSSLFPSQFFFPYLSVVISSSWVSSFLARLLSNYVIKRCRKIRLLKLI